MKKDLKVQFFLSRPPSMKTSPIFGWPTPLGCLAVATYLKKAHPEIEIEVFHGLHVPQEKMEEKADGDFVGIATTTRAYGSALGIAKKAKERGAKVVMGMQFPTFMAAKILQHRPYVDAVVRYDGEVAFTKYVEGAPLHTIPNLVYRENGEIRENPIEFLDLDQLPYPDRALIDLELCFEVFNRIDGPFEKATNMMSQKGCVWRTDPIGGCIFCAIADHTLRLRSPEKVWREVRYLVEDFGIDFIWDTADDIAQDKNWFDEYCRLKPKDLDIHFSYYISAENVTRETLMKLVKVGCCNIFTGLEAAQPEVLQAMNKKATSEESWKAIELLSEYGMSTYVGLVAGIPGDTEESVDARLNLARELACIEHVDRIHWSTLKPVPGSKAFEMLCKDPVVGHKYRNHDLFSLEEMKRDWAERFCKVDYDYLLHVEDEANKVDPYNIFYKPLEKIAGEVS